MANRVDRLIALAPFPRLPLRLWLRVIRRFLTSTKYTKNLAKKPLFLFGVGGTRQFSFGRVCRLRAAEAGTGAGGGTGSPFLPKKCDSQCRDCAKWPAVKLAVLRGFAARHKIFRNRIAGKPGWRVARSVGRSLLPSRRREDRKAVCCGSGQCHRALHEIRPRPGRPLRCPTIPDRDYRQTRSR